MCRLSCSRPQTGYLALFVTHDEFWRRLCDELGEAAWGTDPRFATMHARNDNRVELVALLTAKLAAASAVEWADRLRPLGLAVGAVVDLDYALDSEYVARRGTVVTIPTDGGPLRMVGNPIRVDGVDDYRPPPRLHEHTEEILGEA